MSGSPFPGVSVRTAALCIIVVWSQQTLVMWKSSNRPYTFKHARKIVQIQSAILYPISLQAFLILMWDGWFKICWRRSPPRFWCEHTSNLIHSHCGTHLTFTQQRPTKKPIGTSMKARGRCLLWTQVSEDAVTPNTDTPARRCSSQSASMKRSIWKLHESWISRSLPFSILYLVMLP